MKERPIIFSGPMVNAIREGRKTQTRRVVKWKVREPGLDLQATSLKVGFYSTNDPASGYVLRSRDGHGCWNDRTYPIHCPYGKPGDRLWVRESFRELGSYQKIDGKLPWRGSPDICIYKADAPHDGPFRPSIHMPRWASRLTLEITNVRVERLQDISRADIDAEGIPGNPMNQMVYRNDLYQRKKDCAFLWDKINGKKHPWASNPWVWVIEFKKV